MTEKKHELEISTLNKIYRRTKVTKFFRKGTVFIAKAIVRANGGI